MKFYVLLKEPISNNRIGSVQNYEQWAESNDVDRENGKYVCCPICSAPVSMKCWLPPRRIKLTNTLYPDYISRWAGDGMMVSEHFKEKYEQSGLSGIATFNPVEVVSVCGEKHPDTLPIYFDAIPVISAAVIDHRRSKITGYKHEHRCTLCDPKGQTKSKIHGIMLDDSKWNGEDIFRIYELGGIYFSTQRFVEFCQENKFSNFNFVRSEEYMF